MNTVCKMIRGGRRLAATLLLTGLGVLSLEPARAGSFEVNPVNIVLAANQKATAIKLKNTDQAPLAVRILAYRWTQIEGKDVYSPTKDVIVSPPIMTVPAGGAQLIRIGLRSGTTGSAYRVIVEEIPRDMPEGTGINVALRLDLPLYVLSKNGKSDVRWTAWRNSANDLIVEARNVGTLHSQVLEIGTIGEKRAVLSREMGVVLPNSVRQWKIGQHPEIVTGAPLRLSIRGQSGESQTDVIVESR